MCDMNNWHQSICGTNINEQFSYPMGSYRDQFVGKFLIF